MSKVTKNTESQTPKASSQCNGAFADHISKVKEILRGIDEEILQYEKSKLKSIDHIKYLEGNISGLRRSKTALEIFFQNDLKQEVPNA